MLAPRLVERRYRDPLDAVFLGLVGRLGWQVARSSEVYASWDGRGTLTLASPEHLDPDDCLAQLLLHEVLHWLVMGEGSEHRPDWGLEPDVDLRNARLEYAVHRLQAAFTGRHGLREALAPTTDWRVYYDHLPADPLALDDDPATPLAREAWERAWSLPVGGWIDEALAATAVIARAARPYLQPDDLLAAQARIAPSSVSWTGPVGSNQGSSGTGAGRTTGEPS
jgi:hypothetical protein